ncbi:hypothetical protein CKM354_000833600 [Cercospora kikuchii]|uniref:L-serine ammonia-lyase n=1 Tax=Cercospora kikuchii TaxID=84275 RepID=A0A9P3CRA1_9PEZI|nr:uncharacterized protein CKM354_000833600 [Cercospora kikuchii]GIZ45155.1 hypothetical protein CKM354_000833600 [Cercospora kikuchii]
MAIDMPQDTQPQWLANTGAPRPRNTKKPWRKTPLIESTRLSEKAGCRIFLKLDNLQPSGSFKSRGLGNLVLKSYNNAPDPLRLHYFAASGGNAGLGCVYAANFVGQPATVVVPVTTKKHMIDKLYAAGAKEVLQHGANIAEATAYVNEVLMPQSREKGEEPFYVDPFNHPDIWQGHESIVDEMRDQFEEIGEDHPPDWIICSCGGGGLFNGVMGGIERQGHTWAKTGVIAVETEGADSLNKALEWNEHKAIDKITSIATSLGCVKISERTWDIVRPALKSGKAKNIVLSDAEAAMGSWKLAEEERIIVEAACGVNIALCYGGRMEKVLGRAPRPDESFVIVVCGGSNVSTDMIEEYKRTYRHLVEPSLPGTPIRSPSPINMNTIDHGKKDSVQGSDSELEDAEFVGRYKVPKGYAGHASMGDGYTGFHINDYAVKPHKPSKQKRPQNVIIC